MMFAMKIERLRAVGSEGERMESVVPILVSICLKGTVSAYDKS